MDNKVSLESMLRLAAAELDEQEYQEFKELEQANKLDEPSDEFTQKMQVLLNKEKRSDNFLTFRKNLSKVAAVFMISFSLLSMSFLSVGAVRKSVADVILEWYDGFTKIFIIEERTPATIGNIEFEFVPDGFKMKRANEEFVDFKKYYFENDLGSYFYINIVLANSSNAENADNDTLEYHTVVIDDISGLWLEDNEYNAVIIVRDGLKYTINGYINLSEIISVYKNIKVL